MLLGLFGVGGADIGRGLRESSYEIINHKSEEDIPLGS